MQCTNPDPDCLAATLQFERRDSLKQQPITQICVFSSTQWVWILLLRRCPESGVARERQAVGTNCRVSSSTNGIFTTACDAVVARSLGTARPADAPPSAGRGSAERQPSDKRRRRGALPVHARRAVPSFPACDAQEDRERWGRHATAVACLVVLLGAQRAEALFQRRGPPKQPQPHLPVAEYQVR